MSEQRLPTSIKEITGKRKYYRDLYEDKPAYSRVASAKSILMMDHSFWGFMGLDLVLVEAPHDMMRGTLCTDGHHIFYSAKFINSLRSGEVMFAIAHEIYHCLWGHTGGEGKLNRMSSKDGFDHMLANKAQDYFINNDLKKAGIGEFITTIDILYDPKYDGMSSEEIYLDLMENGDPNPNCSTMDMHVEFEIVDDTGSPTDGSENGDGDEDGNGGGNASKSDASDINEGQAGACENSIKIKITQQQADAYDTKWEETAQRAVAHIENSSPGSAGSIPAHLRRMIAELNKPKIDWRNILRKFTVSIRKTGYSFARPDKRTFGTGVTLPGFRREDKKLTVAVAFDTSGSVGDDALKKFISEFFGIMKGFKSYEIHAFCFEGTVDIASYKLIRSGHQTAESDLRQYVEEHLAGGGGTNFGSVWDFLRMKRVKPRGLVFFTDGYPCDNEWETRDRNYCPTLFITVGNRNGWKAPFGATVQYEDMG